jgi:hypothetical protein
MLAQQIMTGLGDFSVMFEDDGSLRCEPQSNLSIHFSLALSLISFLLSTITHTETLLATLPQPRRSLLMWAT